MRIHDQVDKMSNRLGMTEPLFHFSMRDVQIPSGRVRCVLEGPEDGEPILMLHGNPTWSFFFRSLIEALRTTHRVIVPDHIGMGYSGRPTLNEYSFTLEQRINDLDQLLKLIEPSRPMTIIMHDWGGMIGTGWVINNLHRVSRLIYFNTAAFHLPPKKRLTCRIRIFRVPIIGRILAMNLNLFAKGAVQKCVVKPMPRKVRDMYLAPYSYAVNCEGIYQFIKDIPLSKTHQTYRLISSIQDALKYLQNIPCLVCWGEQDFVFDQDFLDEWKRRLPSAVYVQFPEAGHYLLEDQPREVVKEVKQFMGMPSEPSSIV